MLRSFRVRGIIFNPGEYLPSSISSSYALSDGSLFVTVSATYCEEVQVLMIPSIELEP